MQAVAKLMEQSARIVQAEQGGLARGRPRKIIVVHHNRAHGGRQLALVAVGAHPCARALATAGKVVGQEYAHMAAIGIAHFPDLDAVVVGGDVAAWRKAQSEKAPGHIKHSLGQSLELQKRFDLCFVERIGTLAHFLGPVVPVPRLNVFAGPGDTGFLAGLRGQCGTLLQRFALRRLPGAHQQVAHGAVVAGHGVGQGKVREIGVAQQTRLG